MKERSSNLATGTQIRRAVCAVAAALLTTGLLAGCGTNGVLSDPAPIAKVMPAPTLTPVAGTYAGVQTVTIADTVATAAIYYTTDNSTPTATSNLYVAPFSIKANTTVKAIATAPGYTSSDLASAVYTIAASQAAAPAFSPVPGSYTGPQSLTLADITPGAVIYYTTDGTLPTTASTIYKAPLPLTASGTVSALAVAAGYANSTVTSGVYTINGPQAAAPTVTPGPGTYTSAQTVVLADTTAGAKIYYTVDGTTPTTASTLYTGPITVGTTEILSAIAGGAGFTSSAVASASYTIQLAPASSPAFSPASGTYTAAQTVTITAATPNASIYYTTDGSTPTTASQLYAGPVTVSTSETLTAVAVASGFKTSAAARATYSIGSTASPQTSTFKSVQIVGGGFVDGIVMHPLQRGLMYARTDVGGAYRWDNAANKWTPLTDSLTRDQANYTGIESIGLDPSDPNKLYLAVGTYAESFGANGAILISNDQGATFTTVPLPFKLGSNDKARFAGERLSIDPNLSSHLYFGSRLNGLWESRNFGSAWTQVTNFPVTGSASADPSSTGGVIFEDFLPASGASGAITPTVYVGVDDNTVSALYVTTDAGKTWAAVAGQPSGLFLNRGVIGPDGNLYLSYANQLGPEGVTGGNLWRYTLPTSANPAGLWKNITPAPSFSFTGSVGFGSIAVDPQRPGVVMATTLDLYTPHDDVFRSLDGGNSWIDLGGNQTRDSSLSPWVNFGQSTPGIGNWLVSLTIDPYDSNHVLYGNGQTIWQTTNATAADATTTGAGITTAGVVPTSWSIGAAGLEETVVLSLISPPTGANVLSGVRDIGGFTHADLTTSPGGGMQKPPLFIDTTSLDFAQRLPLTIVRVGNGGTNGQNGAYSSDGGYTWTPFKTQAGSGSGAGSVAIAADGSTILWAPQDGGVFYSKDNGTTWTASSGAPPKLTVIADRVNPKKFYIFNPTSGTLFGSIDAGQSFTTLATGLPLSASLRASYAAEGDLWLAGSSGLLHSTNSGAGFAQLPSTQEAYDVSFGKAAPTAAYPAIYMYGRLSGTQGVFRSIDGGSTWTAVTDAAHQYGYLNTIEADPKVYGRVYLGTSGRGIIYIDAAP